MDARAHTDQGEDEFEHLEPTAEAEQTQKELEETKSQLQKALKEKNELAEKLRATAISESALRTRSEEELKAAHALEKKLKEELTQTRVLLDEKIQISRKLEHDLHEAQETKNVLSAKRDEREIFVHSLERKLEHTEAALNTAKYENQEVRSELNRAETLIDKMRSKELQYQLQAEEFHEVITDLKSQLYAMESETRRDKQTLIGILEKEVQTRMRAEAELKHEKSQTAAAQREIVRLQDLLNKEMKRTENALHRESKATARAVDESRAKKAAEQKASEATVRAEVATLVVQLASLKEQATSSRKGIFGTDKIKPVTASRGNVALRQEPTELRHR